MPPTRLLAHLLATLAILHAGAVLAQQQDDTDDPDEPAALSQSERPAEGDLPDQALSESVLYEFLLGEIALQRGSAGLSAQTYVDLAKRTRDPRIARRALEIAAFARLPTFQIEAARIWHESDPKSPGALQALAGLLVGARRTDEAEPYLEKLLAHDGTAAPNGFMQLNRFLNANPDRAANLRMVQRLAEKYPNLEQADFAVAQAAFAANDEALALQAIRRAAAKRPDWEVAAIFEAQILQRKAPDAAAQRLSGFLEKNPGSREVRLNFARVLVGMRKYAEARTEFQALLAANPNNTEVIYSVGLLAVQLKDFDIAEANLKRLLELGFRESNSVRLTLGQIAEEKKDWQGALEWYRQVGRGEQFLPARLRHAQVLARQGKLDEARGFLRNLDVGGAQQVQVVVAEAQLLREANQHQEAFSVLGKALEGQPDQPELLYDHALTAEKLENFAVLEANLRKLIQARPDHAHAYNALGYSYADRNIQLPEARKLIERALELAPDDFYIVDSMGWVLYRMGDIKGALEQLRRAYDGRPDGEIGAHLGEVLWVSGARDEAERIWKEALEAHPGNETLQKTIKRFKRP